MLNKNTPTQLLAKSSGFCLIFEEPESLIMLMGTVGRYEIHFGGLLQNLWSVFFLYRLFVYLYHLYVFKYLLYLDPLAFSPHKQDISHLPIWDTYILPFPMKQRSGLPHWQNYLDHQPSGQMCSLFLLGTASQPAKVLHCPSYLSTHVLWEHLYPSCLVHMEPQRVRGEGRVQG